MTAPHQPADSEQLTDAEIAALRRRRAGSFGAVAEDYDRLRPQAPPDAIDWLLPAGCARVADVAAGTGLLTRLLLGRVPEVTAVEPDPRMREVLERKTSGAVILDGTAEDLPFDDASLDCVLIASAWHWVDPARALPEIARVLRDGGRFGALWTTHDRGQPWVAALDARRPTVEGGGPQRWHRIELPDRAPFTGVTDETFHFDRTMPLDDVVDLMATYSAAIIATPEERAEGLARTRMTLLERFPDTDTATIPHRCYCWRADRAPRP